MAFTRSEDNWFAAQQRRAQQGYDLGHEQNEYDKSVKVHQNRWANEDLRRRFAEQRQRWGTSHQRRGMWHSGNRSQDFARFLSDQQRMLARQAEGHGYTMEGFQTAESQLAKVRDDALAEIEFQRDAYEKTLAGVARI